MAITRFTDLETWKEAHTLTLLVYKVTKIFPKEELYGLIMQLRRATVSVESCIAEGFARYHYKDRLNFNYDARGSVHEVQCQMIIAKDLAYISEQDFQKVCNQAEKVGIILGGLIRSTERLSKK